MNAIPIPIASAPEHSERQSSELSSSQIKELVGQGFSEGLAKSFTQTLKEFPLRIWVIDNSGSMQKTDGHRIISGTNSDVKIVNSTRWNEIKETVEYHIQLSALLRAPTSFRLLNHPGAHIGSQQFDICQMGSDNIPSEVSKAMSIMSRVRPGGVTPLTDRVNEIYIDVKSMMSSLEMEGKRVAIVLATDGLPTDSTGISDAYNKQCFVESLRRLEGLPIWLVIRLCTDEEEVVDFYNSLDDELELSMDVLDDYIGKAEEVYEHNEWLNYTLPLHRLREMGHHDRVFDLIDERKLNKMELKDFCMLLFGSDNMDGTPDPDIDWDGFISDVERLLSTEKQYWHPIKKRMKPWLSMNKLKRNTTGTCSIM